MDIDANIITALAAGLGGIIAGASKHTAAIVLAVKDALVARDSSISRELRERLKEVEGRAALCAIGGRMDEPDLLEMLDLALEEHPIVGGIVCEKGYYVSTFGFSRWMNHEDVAGLPWDDPRFVHPDDLPNSLAVAAQGMGRGNRGQRICLLNGRGQRVPGRVYSMHPVTAGERAYRLFLVWLEVTQAGV